MVRRVRNIPWIVKKECRILGDDEEGREQRVDEEEGLEKTVEGEASQEHV